MENLQPAPHEIRVGDRVRNRGERWCVTAVERYTDCAIVTLAGSGPTNRSTVRRLIAPADRLERITAVRRLRLVTKRRWRSACRTLLAAAGPAWMLRTAITARMDLLPHQLAPALALVRGLGSRVLIADDVGLGKTVQAGLIIAELRARHAAARVLVLTPAGLREQWLEELRRRFSLPGTIVDAAALRGRQRGLPTGMNPWAIDDVVIASTDFVKRPDMLRAVADVPWDLVVVDEAHGVVAPSDRHAAVAVLARHAPHVVLLTATPHSGDERAFSSLCGIGAHDDQLLVFRRTRKDAGLPADRRVHPLVVQPTVAERHLHELLGAFAAAVERDAHARDDRVALILSTLRKRACSSAASLARSVEQRLAIIAAPVAQAADQLPLPFDNGDGTETADEVPAWTMPVLSDVSIERAWLMRLADAAREASRGESKLQALQRLLRRVREPIVVFTEYRDTLLYVQSTVAPDAQILHGGLSRAERRESLRRFDEGRLLLATDAAGEGLNLHHRSRIVVNLELPWNPIRLEQRVGRVDRIGQRARVHAFHLIGATTGEIAVLQRLQTKVAVADAAVGVADPLRRTDSRASAPALIVCQLIDDADEVARHLKAARALVKRAAEASSAEHPSALLAGLLEEGPLFTSASRRLRRVLQGRSLVVTIHGFDADDTADTTFAIRGVTMAEGRLGLGQLDATIPLLERVPADGPETPSSFWERRMRRLRTIADGIVISPRAAQPGLFDRREVSAAELTSTRARDRQRTLAERIEAAARRMIPSPASRWVALVINGARDDRRL